MITSLFFSFTAASFCASWIRSDAFALNKVDTSPLARACEVIDQDDVAFGCAIALLFIVAALSNRLIARRRAR